MKLSEILDLMEPMIKQHLASFRSETEEAVFYSKYSEERDIRDLILLGLRIIRRRCLRNGRF